MKNRCAWAVIFGLVLASACLAAETTEFSNVLPAGATVSIEKSDGSGNIYVTGTYIVGPADYPARDLYIGKISSDGTSLTFLTDLGVSGGYPTNIQISGIAVEPDGTACVLLAVNTQIGSWSEIDIINPSGAIGLQMSSFLGAFFNFDLVEDVAADSAGSLYFTGFGSSGGAVFKLDPTATKLLWQVNGYGGSLAVDGQGNVYVQGLVYSGGTLTTSANAAERTYPDNCAPSQCSHQYVAKIDATGSRVIYATYLTGSYSESPAGIAVDTAGNAYVAGYTDSTDYPTTANAFDDVFPALAPSQIEYLPGPGFLPATGYISSLDPTGNIRFSTFFGGSATDALTGIAVDSTNNILYVGGNATSPDLPGLAGADHHCIPQSFVSELPTDGSGVGRSVPVPNLEAFWVNGKGSVLFATGSEFDQINFNAKDTPIACLANSADLSAARSVVPGQLLTMFGNQLAASAEPATVTANLYPTALEGLSVTINGLPAPLLYVSPDQVNLQVPFEIAGQSQVVLQLQTVDQDGAPLTDTRTLSVNAAYPIVFQRLLAPGECPGSYPGETQTAAVNQDGSVNGCSNPAKPNSTVTIFVDGLGNLVPAAITGANNAAAAPLTIPVSFTNSNPAPTPTFVTADSPMGWITGLYAVQIQAPAASTQTMLVIGQTTAQGPVSIAVAP